MIYTFNCKSSIPILIFSVHDGSILTAFKGERTLIPRYLVYKVFSQLSFMMYRRMQSQLVILWTKLRFVAKKNSQIVFSGELKQNFDPLFSREEKTWYQKTIPHAAARDATSGNTIPKIRKNKQLFDSLWNHWKITLVCCFEQNKFQIFTKKKMVLAAVYLYTSYTRVVPME